MTLNIGAALSTDADSVSAARIAASQAGEALGSNVPDLGLVFVSPHHAGAAEDVVQAVQEATGARGLIGCVGEAVLAGAREVEREPAVSVWLGALPGGARTFHLEYVPTPSGGEFTALPEQEGDRPGLMIIVCDPFSFPADLFLEDVNQRFAGLPVVGGMASGAREPGGTILFLDGEVRRSGAVGALLPGAAVVRTFVSQGCRPIGQSFTVTRAERNLLFELGGRPPLQRLQETLNALSFPDRQLLSQGLHLGRVIDEYRQEHGLGDFLIRGVVGADPETGAMAVGDHLEVGQTVQFHVRDAATADEELRTLLERSTSSLPGRPAGALLFTCNGRGSRMFSTPDHDAGLVSSYLGGAPLAGFFCAGELGPVGGKNFLHGFTASLAVFVGGSTGDDSTDASDGPPAATTPTSP